MTAMNLDVLRQMIDQDPGDTMLRFVLGQKLFEEGTPADRPEAIEHLRFVQEHDQKNAAAWYVLAQALAAAGHEREACDVLHGALHKIDGDPAIDGTDLRPQIEEMLEELE